jgi:ATP-dependent RNA helicase DeaD
LEKPVAGPEGGKKGVARREKPRDDRPPRDARRDEPRDVRGPRPEPRFERGPIPHDQGMTRLFLSLGKTHGVMAKEIVGMLYREAGLPDGCLGRITLFPKHSLVDVPAELVHQVLERTRNARLRGRPFRIDVDRGPL